jgi:hypothetical protein
MIIVIRELASLLSLCAWISTIIMGLITEFTAITTDMGDIRTIVWASRP